MERDQDRITIGKSKPETDNVFTMIVVFFETANNGFL